MLNFVQVLAFILAEPAFVPHEVFADSGPVQIVTLVLVSSAFYKSVNVAHYLIMLN